MNKILKEIVSIVKEVGLIGDLEFHRDLNNRKELSISHPDAFLIIRGDIPKFPIKGQMGTSSIVVLKKSLANAKRLKNQTGEPIYNKIIKRINKEIEDVNNKSNTKLTLYNPNNGLYDEVNRFGR